MSFASVQYLAYLAVAASYDDDATSDGLLPTSQKVVEDSCILPSPFGWQLYYLRCIPVDEDRFGHGLYGRAGDILYVRSICVQV